MDGPGRILLVDDDPEAREMLGEFLVDEGFVVETAADGRSALGKLDGFRADLVITDLEMPGMGGLELMQRLQLHAPPPPALLMTARDDCSETCRSAGAHPIACLMKPVDLEQLAVVLHRLFDAGPQRVLGAAAGGQ